MMLPDPGLAAPLLDAALRGAVLLLLAWAATRLMRRASAASRHLVWSAALAGVVLLPVLGVVVPRWRVLPVPGALAPAAQPAAVSPSAAPAPSSPSAGDAPPERIGWTETAPGVPAPGSGEPAARGSVSSIAEIPVPLPRADWRAILLLAWGAGAALLMLRLGYGVAQVWLLERRAVEITDDAWVRVVDGLARRLRVGRIVILLRGPGAAVPMTWGLLHPVVLLPEEADGWDHERRTAVLAHELAHVRRWDALTQWVAHLAMALFWFNPLVWVACRKAREEREHACDDAVLAMGTQPTRYAGHLLEIVRELGTTEGPAAALAMARRSQFEGRLLAILDRATPRGGVSRASVLATLGLTAAVAVPLAALTAAPRVPAPAGEPVEAAAAEEPAPPAASAAAALEASASPPASAVPPVRRAPESPAVAAVWALETDGVRAEHLVRLVKTRPDTGVYVEIARAAARMTSPVAQREVLVAVVTCPEVDSAGVAAAVESVAAVRSSADQRDVLAQVARRGWLRGASVRRAFFRSVETLSGSSDRRDLLRLVLERGHTDPESLASVITAAGRLRGSSDVRDVLAPAAATGKVTGGLRDLYLRTASAIRDESDRAYALSALLGARQEPTEGGNQVNVQGAAGKITLPSDTPDAEGWVTRMVLTDGNLAYDDERDGEEWQLLVEGKDFLVQSKGSTSRVVVRPGGRVVLRETGPVTRSVEIRSDSNGRESRSYSVDGRRRAHGAEAEAWTAAFHERLNRHLHARRSSATRPRTERPADDGASTWDSTQEAIHEHHGRPASRTELSARSVRILDGRVVGILPGGGLTVEQTLYPDYPDPDPLKRPGGTVTRRLEGRRAGDGGVQWRYAVDGVERPFAGEARAWFDRILRKFTTVR